MLESLSGREGAVKQYDTECKKGRQSLYYLTFPRARRVSRFFSFSFSLFSARRKSLDHEIV